MCFYHQIRMSTVKTAEMRSLECIILWQSGDILQVDTLYETPAEQDCSHNQSSERQQVQSFREGLIISNHFFKFYFVIPLCCCSLAASRFCVSNRFSHASRAGVLQSRLGLNTLSVFREFWLGPASSWSHLCFNSDLSWSSVYCDLDLFSWCFDLCLSLWSQMCTGWLRPPRRPLICDNGHLVGHYPLCISQLTIKNKQ